MTGPLGNSEVCFPRISMFPRRSLKTIKCSLSFLLSRLIYVEKTDNHVDLL